jgi:hypothetical protein
MVVSLFGAACSKPPAKKLGSAKPIETAAPIETPAPATAPPTNAPSGPVAKKTTTGRAVNPRANVTQASKIGALIKAQSTKCVDGKLGPGQSGYKAGCDTWVGVTKDSIKLTFTYNKGDCGADIIAVLGAAGAALDAGTRFYRPAARDRATADKWQEESIDFLVKFFNDTAFEGADFLPQIRPLMGNDAGHQFYGRKLTHQIIDGGSFQAECQDKTKRAATDIVQEHKPFSVLTNFDGTQYNMATTLQDKTGNNPTARPMHFGTLHLSDRVYNKLAPYAWTQFISGSSLMDKFASYICSQLVGKKAVRDFNSSAITNNGPIRKFGLATVNLPEAKQVVEDFRGSLNKYCAGKGGDKVIADETEYDPDTNRMADQGQQMFVKYKREEITSIIYLEPLAPILQIGQATGQGYYPEWVWPGLGYTDTAYVQRIYTSLSFGEKQMDRASFGITGFGVPGGFGYGAGDPFWAWHRYHKTAPDGKACDPTSEAGMSRGVDDGSGGYKDKNQAVELYCKAPGASYVTWYYTALPMVACLIFAGPNLNPNTCTDGLQNYPRTRYGGNGPTDDPRPALVGARAGQYYFIQDAIEWRWRTRYTSPYPEHRAGWVEWPDCQRHYFTWPDKLSDFWEVNGPNYNKWCGDPKYAPDPLVTKNAVTGQPERYDEKDGYPAITSGKNPNDLE